MSVFILENVSKSFKVDKTENVVLRNINLTLPDKGLVSIVGKSGSGKSTLLNILLGIEKPSKGSVYFNRKNIYKFSDRKFSKYHLSCVSLIFQHYNLFNDLTGLDNVILPLKMQGIKTKKAKADANELFAKFNIEKLAYRKVKNLSGGEKQRIAILRAIITRPKAILCDEPTGALDSKNSREIMGILKEISENTLVIMVSHNKDLVNEFSDQILVIKDGEIVDNNSNIKDNFTSKFEVKKIGYKPTWARQFLALNLRKNFKKNLFSIIACSIAFAAMFVSVGFSEGSRSSQEEALMKNLSIGFATASKNEYIDLEGSPLLFKKTTRPELNEVDLCFENFESIRCEENIQFFVSNYPSCNFDGLSFSNFSMIPLFDSSLQNYGEDLICRGSKCDGSFEEIYVNSEFEKLVGKNLLNKSITISNSATVNYSTGEQDFPFIKDTLNLEKKFKIVGILDEFSFLNTPKIYYSYQGAKKFLKASPMENLSSFLGTNYSYFDYLIDCKNDDPVSSYSAFIFLNDLSEVDEFFEVVKKSVNTELEITSSAFEVRETYGTFINSFSTTLIVFVIIAFAGINFILGMISLSTFIENRKNTAIMTCLGSKNSSIYNLYLTENYFVIILSLTISVFLAKFLQKFLNPLISQKFALNHLIQIPFGNYFGLPYGLILVISAIAIIFSTIFTVVPMVLYRHKSLADELRDE